MNNNYLYIVEKLGPPIYYDIHGAPCYQFSHYDLADDWTKFIKTIKSICCQACGTQFIVQCCDPVYTEPVHPNYEYGDPPIHNCVGDTMMADHFTELSPKEVKTILKLALKYASAEQIPQIAKRMRVKPIKQIDTENKPDRGEKGGV